MYSYTWPIGTCHHWELPADVQAGLDWLVTGDGYVSEALAVHETATEGPYVEFGGYKVRVTLESATPTTFLVRLA
jgi:hypothetical protein